MRAFQVQRLSDVNLKQYVEGDIFITKQSVGILTQGKIKTFIFKQADLSDYVKKDVVKKMIEKELKKND